MPAVVLAALIAVACDDDDAEGNDGAGTDTPERIRGYWSCGISSFHRIAGARFFRR
ncbi:MAG: hypothetical protein R6V85_14975 [Polyangia bacterium]